MSMFDEMLDGEHSQQLNERPYSRTQSAIDSAKGKVKGIFGSGQIEQGAAMVGNQANQYWKEFKMYIGKKYGKAMSAVPYADVSNFFKANNLDPKFLGSNERRMFDPRSVGSALLQAVREQNDTYKQDEPEQQSAGNTDNGNSGNNNADKPQSEPAPVEQPQSSPANSGSNSDLKTQISTLSPSDREKLLSLLS